MRTLLALRPSLPEFLKQVAILAFAATAIFFSTRALGLPSGQHSIAFLLAFACGILDSAVGMGYGTALTPLLLVIGLPPTEAVPAVLVSQIFVGFIASGVHNQMGNVKFNVSSEHSKTALRLLVGGLIGVSIGALLVLHVSKNAFQLIIAGIVIFTGFVMFKTRKAKSSHQDKPSPVLRVGLSFVGALAGFNKVVSGGGCGPLMTSGQIVNGVDEKAAAGISSLVKGLISITGLSILWSQGAARNIGGIGFIVAGAAIAPFLGAKLVKARSNSDLRMWIAAATICLGFVSLLKAVM